MTQKEKAIELVDKFYQTTPNECFVNEPIGIAGRYKAWNQSKQCTLIAVDEILELKETQEEYQIQYDNGEWSRELGYRYSKYWQEVKQEIENL